MTEAYSLAPKGDNQPNLRLINSSDVETTPSGEEDSEHTRAARIGSTVVLLVAGDEETWRLIDGNDDQEEGNWDVDVRTKFGQALLGAVIGQVVEWPNVVRQRTESGEILAIEHPEAESTPQ